MVFLIEATVLRSQAVFSEADPICRGSGTSFTITEKTTGHAPAHKRYLKLYVSPGLGLRPGLGRGRGRGHG